MSLRYLHNAYFSPFLSSIASFPIMYEKWNNEAIKITWKDESLWSFHWYLIRMPHYYPLKYAATESLALGKPNLLSFVGHELYVWFSDRNEISSCKRISMLFFSISSCVARTESLQWAGAHFRLAANQFNFFQYWHRLHYDLDFDIMFLISTEQMLNIWSFQNRCWLSFQHRIWCASWFRLCRSDLLLITWQVLSIFIRKKALQIICR